MTTWRRVTLLDSEEAFDDYRDGDLCCAAIFLKRDSNSCRVCVGCHTMIERRLQCKSATCAQFGECSVIYKVLHCTASDKWLVMVNSASHSRGALPCTTVLPAHLSKKMKKFIGEQDEIGNPFHIILMNLKRQTSIPTPRRGWPTPLQIQNALKKIRRDHGTKKSIRVIESMVRSHSYTSDIALNKAFLFGHKFDKDGFAYVGSGEDDDPFIIGITSLAMIDSALKFASTSTFTMFHADATFKLSDIGYPVISCGFTDQARSYQLGALFIVSRRSAYEYGECFRSFAQLVRSLRGQELRIDANMGDAEDAQFLALSSLPEFAEANVLMCFFHVLYNVQKKTQQFLPADRYTVMRSIMDMHYCSSQHEYDLCKKAELAKWRESTHLQAFAKYFEDEWIKGRFWRWQVYHTPQGYATTNNPCETFNAVIKAFVQRRRLHMRLLLQKLVDLIETLEPKQPVTSDYVAVPTTELVRAAVSMMDSNRVTVQNTDNPKCVYVKELRAGVRQEDVEDHEEALEQFSIAFGDSESLEQIDEGNLNEPVVTDPDVVLTGVDNVGHTNDLVARLHPCTTECEQEDVPAKARELETQAVKWSLRRAHRLGIPDQGWIVDLERHVCGCKYFAKMLACAHIIVAERTRGLNGSRHDPAAKLKNRVARKKQTKKAQGKTRKNRPNRNRSLLNPTARSLEDHPRLLQRWTCNSFSIKTLV